MDLTTTTYLPPSFNRLKLLWLRFGVISLIFLAIGTLVLQITWESRFALRWLALAAPALAYLSLVFRVSLHYNHRPDEISVLPTLGAGNLMTLARGVLLSGLIGFLFTPKPDGWLAWIPGLLYTLAIAADFLDGYLARRTNHVTRLGEILDMSIDGVGVFAAATLAVIYGQAPAWYLLIALARYGFLAGLWLLKILGKPIYPLKPSIIRRVLAGFQMGFLAVILWPVMAPPGSLFVATLFGIPFLAGFSLDWLVVSGILKPHDRSSTLVGSFSIRLLDDLPVLLRGGVMGLLVWVTVQHIQDPVLPTWLLIMEWAAALFITLGSAGRIFAVASLILLGIGQVYAPVTGEQYILAALYTGLLYLGSGKFSLWKPEDKAVYRQSGSQSTASEPEQTA